jgi:FKBP-type peptidyl-prolyl cis-trans isomerase FkpA
MTARIRFGLTACLFALVLASSACGFFQRVEKPNPEEDKKSQTGKTALEVVEVKPGTGTEARPGRRVVVNYSGWLFHPDKPQHRGRLFDSSELQGKPYEFTIGASEAIPGWDEGISGMKAGGKRTLVIPPSMAYGRRGYGESIPPNATLVFDFYLVDLYYTL